MIGKYVVAYMFTTVGGFVAVWLLLSLIRWHATTPNKLHLSGRLVFWVGSVERAVVTTLVVVGPSYVASFMGAWLVLKLAADWGRFKDDSEPVRHGHMIALIGTVASFSVAIAVGVWLNPSALQYFGRIQ